MNRSEVCGWPCSSKCSQILGSRAAGLAERIPRRGYPETEFDIRVAPPERFASVKVLKSGVTA